MNLTTRGWLNGFIGMAIFSGSLPATRVAVLGLDPLFVTAARAGLAGVLATFMLVLAARRDGAQAVHGQAGAGDRASPVSVRRTRQPTGLATQARPAQGDWVRLVLVALGVVLGFPLFTALALQSITSAHSLVFIGLLPMSTALFAAWLAQERPSRSFWTFAVLGALAVVGFAFSQDGSGVLWADGLMVLAIVSCGYGYAEGGRLARRLGAWQVICWVLVVSLPVSLPLAFIWAPRNLAAVPPSAWAGGLYVAIFSMLVGFIFWYRGLAQGGIAAVGQLQLLQPFLGLLLAAWLLGEPVTPAMLWVTAFVVACVAGARYTAAMPAPSRAS
ncbi:DMT family transporter [Castellaniella sp.]|uniref:DMT family transporter n=1 Tax=Castellaniella sp. TaxID=1955812 RepID=UPI00355FEDB3